MSTTMRRGSRTTLERAVGALQPFYDPEDDGYPIKLALDAIAGVLGTKAGLGVEAKNGLSLLLEELKAPAELRDGVEELYEHARGGEYGAGLSKKQANAINDLVQDVVDPLVEFVTAYRRRSPGRPRARRRTPAKRRKR